ncbi:hypothetical protein M422DRAFT_185684 [Sphaerobolus stellatus SS14]|uniref:Nephrocystin 3-like N-terminal domain-containing protein n=1 Tax=Sphaerobolus stellatus (strain SS14) TaxID=990650 RepID=A0A0C9V276_SPHS4|nr:hypothetical protein M422DRAFT_185684 [Sphaerobolus stellatus SS14]
MDRLIPESLTKKLRKTDLPSKPPRDVSSSAFTAAIVHQQPLEPIAATSNSNSTSTTPNNQPEGGARKRNIAKAVIKETLRTIVNVTDVFPPLKSVAAGILEIIERYDAVHNVQRGFTELQKQLEGLLAVVRLYQDDVPVNVMNALTGLARAIEEKKTVLEKKLGQSVPVRGVAAPANIAFMTETLRDMSFAIQIVLVRAVFPRGINLSFINIYRWTFHWQLILKHPLFQTRYQISTAMVRLTYIESVKLLMYIIVYLGKLGSVAGAEFNHEDRQGCMQGTRVLLLAELWKWGINLSAPHIFWLSGIAGTGKTTVLETFCRMLDKEGLLGGSFFCSRKSKDRATLQNIFPSLAQAMARTFIGFKEELMKVLQHKECADPLGMNLADQYKLLILQPAKAAFEWHTASIVLAIDALDECEGGVATKKLLDVILTSRSVEYLKIIVTSRPEPPIRSAFQSKHHSGFHLHEIEDHIVEADIMMYMTHRLQEIPQLRDEYADIPWPPQEVTILAKRAGGLFIYVSTICAYIDDYKGSPNERLKKLCSLTTLPTLAVAGIDNMYTFILSEAFRNIDLDENTHIQACLSLLVSATQPLQVIGYARLLNTTPKLVRAALQSLHSVIHVPEKDADGEIIPYHASFPDYLITESRAGSQEWFINLYSAHSSSADWCFAIMERELHFGIGGATKIYKNDVEAKTMVNIPSYLAYVCTAWVYHVLGSLLQGSHSRWIESFLHEKLLYWLEVLSVEGNVRTGGALLNRLSQNMSIVKMGLLDAAKFIGKFMEPIAYSPSHIYISALPFCSQNSMVSQWVKKVPSLPVVELLQGTLDQPLIFELQGHTDMVCSVSFSPDGRYIASGSDDHTVRLWSVETGMPVGQPYEGHTYFVRSVSFSPDGRYIASGSSDRTVRLWSVETGMPVGQPYEGHTHWVSSVSFSPDGRYIASGSSDHTVHLWSVETGMPVGQPYEGHTSSVMSVSFSPDGRYIASGSLDYTVRLWSVETGMPVGQPYDGHTSSVWSVSFSPDGRYIASGSSDHTVHLWSVENGMPVGQPYEGHTSSVSSVSFSPDGRYIASGSVDYTVRLWSVETGMPVGQPYDGHTDSVRSVSFSPDGRYIASGSDNDTVRLWSVETGMPLVDSTYIASGSDNDTVRLWSVETGMPVGQSYEGHTDWVSSVSFSPDGRYIASGSSDHTVCLWSVENGMPVGQPYEGHTGWLNSVSLSPDGRYISSGSGNQTAFWWNAEDGMQAVQPYKGSFQMFNSYQISPTSPCSLLLHEFPTGFLLLTANGWLVTHTGNRVFWIPFDLRKGLFMPGTSCIFSVKTMIKIDLTGFHLGKEWGILVESIIKGTMPMSSP